MPTTSGQCDLFDVLVVQLPFDTDPFVVHMKPIEEYTEWYIPWDALEELENLAVRFIKLTTTSDVTEPIFALEFKEEIQIKIEILAY